VGRCHWNRLCVAWAVLTRLGWSVQNARLNVVDSEFNWDGYTNPMDTDRFKNDWIEKLAYIVIALFFVIYLLLLVCADSFRATLDL